MEHLLAQPCYVSQPHYAEMTGGSHMFISVLLALILAVPAFSQNKAEALPGRVARALSDFEFKGAPVFRFFEGWGF